MASGREGENRRRTRVIHDLHRNNSHRKNTGEIFKRSGYYHRHWGIFVFQQVMHNPLFFVEMKSVTGNVSPHRKHRITGMEYPWNSGTGCTSGVICGTCRKPVTALSVSVGIIVDFASADSFIVFETRIIRVLFILTDFNMGHTPRGHCPSDNARHP